MKLRNGKEIWLYDIDIGIGKLDDRLRSIIKDVIKYADMNFGVMTASRQFILGSFYKVKGIAREFALSVEGRTILNMNRIIQAESIPQLLYHEATHSYLAERFFSEAERKAFALDVVNKMEKINPKQIEAGKKLLLKDAEYVDYINEELISRYLGALAHKSMTGKYLKLDLSRWGDLDKYVPVLRREGLMF